MHLHKELHNIMDDFSVGSLVPCVLYNSHEGKDSQVYDVIWNTMNERSFSLSGSQIL
jgi:hypothetical protein